MGHLQQIARQAARWLDEVFGRLTGERPALVAAEPGQPGNIYDGFAYRQWEQQGWSPETRTEVARLFLAGPGLLGPEPARVLAEHRAVLSGPGRDRPVNADDRIAAEVSDDLLRAPAIITRVLNIERGWQAEATPDEQKILVARFRSREGRQAQRAPWEMAQILIHEILHLMAHPRYVAHVNSLPFAERTTLAEGVVDFLTEIVWNHVRARFTEPGYLDSLRSEIEAGHAIREALPDLPHPAATRYAAHVEATRVVSEVGIGNLLEAYFLGNVEKIAGPGPGSPRSMLAPAGTDRPHPRPPADAPPAPPPAPPAPPAPPPPSAEQEAKDAAARATAEPEAPEAAARAKA